MKNYFAFTRLQRTGVVVWVVLILFGIVLLNVNFKKNHSNPFDVSESDMKYVQLNAQKKNFERTNYSSNKYKNRSTNLSYFNPNKIDKEAWKNLGFSDKQADVILNYKKDKGPFKKKEDLKKIFVISKEKYAELEPFIILDSLVVVNEHKTKIELNSADATELETIRGIGPGFSGRIIKYRASLGGFVSITQLHEVYNMTEELYQSIIERVEIDLNSVVKIDINSATKEEIDRHPYITWPMTAEILKKRDQEKISSLDFLIQKGIMTESERQKVELYIRYE